jgi:hypothetical protein
MTVLLTKEEKSQVIISHKKSLAYSRYNMEIDLIQENAKAYPDADAISTITERIVDVDDQLDALDAELTAVNSLEE